MALVYQCEGPLNAGLFFRKYNFALRYVKSVFKWEEKFDTW